MENGKTLSETWQPEGFILRVEELPKFDGVVEAVSEDPDDFAGELQSAIDDAPEVMTMESAYNLAGDYIGGIGTARMLCGKRGIEPEKAKESHGVCSIGFCEREQKWYGWSHRAIYGFGIGSTCSKGDCSYVSKDWGDFLEDAARFWDEEHHEDVKAVRSVNADGKPIARVTWTYTTDVPNKTLHDKISGADMYPPDKWGRGEWTAKTLDEAKEMAIDFAEGVS